MRLTLLLLFSFVSGFSYSQQTIFPSDWVGTWKGNLLWYKEVGKPAVSVPMQLDIRLMDSLYTWQLIYGENGKDNRPYTLLAVDTAKGKWRIDENNGILIDMQWLANRFSGAFTVGQTTIINSYRIENGKLIVEFYNISAKPSSTSGLGTNESPTVNSYGVRSYQYAELTR